jgi:general secretion pathway protein N
MESYEMMRTTVVLLTGLMLTGGAGAAVEAPLVSDPSEVAAPQQGRTETGGVAASRPVQTLRGNPLAGISLGSLNETRARPLFTLSRRPPPPVAVAVESKAPPPPPPPPEPEKPELSLVGTVTGTDTGIGLFRDAAGKNVQLKTGEYHQGWILRAVQRHQVTFGNGTRVAVLTLPPPDAKKTMGMGGTPVAALPFPNRAEPPPSGAGKPPGLTGGDRPQPPPPGENPFTRLIPRQAKQ